jgi:hypothetical protein
MVSSEHLGREVPLSALVLEQMVATYSVAPTFKRPQ